METYAEKRGEKVMDWNAFLDNAIYTNIEYHGKQHNKAIGLARNWVSCACGNQCYIIPRDATGRPRDGVLYQLGLNFSIEIYAGEWKESKSTLIDIEKRSQEIIDEINN